MHRLFLNIAPMACTSCTGSRAASSGAAGGNRNLQLWLTDTADSALFTLTAAATCTLRQAVGSMCAGTGVAQCQPREVQKISGGHKLSVVTRGTFSTRDTDCIVLGLQVLVAIASMLHHRFLSRSLHDKAVLRKFHCKGLLYVCMHELFPRSGFSSCHFVKMRISLECVSCVQASCRHLSCAWYS